ncbi:MAG: 3'-5' exonuclease [Planctomycetaceae bacterium]|nr:3'-5' exonuclease [Planctomycetaceae bacterium]
MSDVRYLIFDVEAVGDGDLIQRVRYPDEELTPSEAVERYRKDLLESTGRDVIPPTFVQPISVAVAKVGGDFRLRDLTVLDAPEFRPSEITRRFWQGWQHYDRPTLVTFNGRGYDIPVLELGAFRYGISVPAWFNVDSRSFEQSRNRYNLDTHIDLQDFFSNFGAVRVSGGLNMLANLIDKPGKSGIDGSQVQGLYEQGHADRINDYCRCDVLDTYFVFLRTRVLVGKITLEEEKELVAETRNMLEEQADRHPAYQHYLQFWDKRLEHRRAWILAATVDVIAATTVADQP